MTCLFKHFLSSVFDNPDICFMSQYVVLVVCFVLVFVNLILYPDKPDLFLLNVGHSELKIGEKLRMLHSLRKRQISFVQQLDLGQMSLIQLGNKIFQDEVL